MDWALGGGVFISFSDYPSLWPKMGRVAIQLIYYSLKSATGKQKRGWLGGCYKVGGPR